MAKILVVANFSVPPIIAGSQRCVYNYCETLRGLGHEVYFLFSGYMKEEEGIKADFWNGYYFHYRYTFLQRTLNYIKRKLVYLLNGFNYTIGYYYPVYGLNRFVGNLQKKHHFDAIIVNYPWMSPLLQKTSIPLKLIFTHDKFTDKKKIVKENYYTLTANQEAEALNRADIVLSIQDEETQYFRKTLPHKKILTVYTKFDFKESISNNLNTILFFSGDNVLNRNGIFYFVKKVWPLVKMSIPTAKLLIGGGICKSLKSLLCEANIELVGYVEDVDKFYQKGNVAINPVYQGTGLKIKTLEAISYGKITVVHPHSIAGLYKNRQAPVYVGITDAQYAQYIIDALKGDINAKEVSDKCNKYIKEMDAFIEEQFKSINFE